MTSHRTHLLYFLIFSVLIIFWIKKNFFNPSQLAGLHAHPIVKLQGIISSIPETNTDQKSRFEFLVKKINGTEATPFNIKLSWHFPPPLHAGEEWLVQTNIHPIHSL